MLAKILLVDDCPLIIRMYCDFLTLAGHDVLSSPSPFGVLHAVRTQHPDVVLVDINLPGMNGSRVAELIRKHDATRIIGISASAESELRALLRDRTIDDWFLKSDSLESLALKILAAGPAPC